MNKNSFTILVSADFWILVAYWARRLSGKQCVVLCQPSAWMIQYPTSNCWISFTSHICWHLPTLVWIKYIKYQIHFKSWPKTKKNWYDIFGIILSCSMGSSICPFLRAALLGKQCAASKLMRRNLCQDCPSGRSRIGTYINSCILCLIHTMIVSTTCTTSMTQTYITTGQINFKKTMHACIPCMHAFQPSQHTYWVRIYICVLNWNENCILHLSYE